MVGGKREKGFLCVCACVHVCVRVCASARGRERRRDLLHMDVSWHVFFIMHSASLGVLCICACVCVCDCMCVFEFGGGGRVTERI